MLLFMNGNEAGRVIELPDSPVVLGRDPRTDAWIEAPGVSRRHARVWRESNGVFHIQDLASANGTYICGRRIEAEPLASGDYVQLGDELLLRFEVVDEPTRALRQRLHDASTRDALTHLYNRRYFLGRFVAEVAHAQWADGDVSLLMLDIDRFKRFNDTFGHLPGDRALAFIATRLLQQTRAEDVVARWGGEEFVVLSRACPEEAMELARRLLRRIAALGFSVAQTPVSLTVSIGVASLLEIDPAENPIRLLALADQRLYSAKLSGRNRVCAV
jgi:diguanylate cyclase (GGDEF)-like protein